MIMVKKVVLLLLCALVPISAAQAVNIAWVTIHPTDDEPAPGSGPFDDAPDKGYTDLLTANGHTVTRFLSSNVDNPAAMATLNSYDLVIIGRGIGNSAFFGSTLARKDAWNTLTVPMILTNGYVERASRLGWATTSTIPDVQNPIPPHTFHLQASDPSHPIFAGIPLDGTNTMVNPFGHQVFPVYNDATPVTIQGGPSVVMDLVAPPGGEGFTTLVPGGTTIARVVGITASGANGGTMIAYFPPGTVPAPGPVGGGAPFGGKRLLFLTGSRENNNNAPGIYDLDPDGARMLLNAVRFMTIPEPSSAVLLGMGALLLLLRRKK